MITIEALAGLWIGLRIVLALMCAFFLIGASLYWGAWIASRVAPIRFRGHVTVAVDERSKRND